MATYEIVSEETNKQSPLLASEEYVPKAMPSILGSLDMTSTYLIAVFFIVNAVTATAGGPAAFTYLILGAVTFFIPCAIATAQLGVILPHEGSLYNWTHRALGGYWSFFIGFCAWFPGVLVVVAGADIVVSFIQGLNSNWLVEPWQQGVVLIAIIVFSAVVAIQRLRTVQYIVNVVVGLILLAVIIIGLAGIVWLAHGHHSMTNFSKLSDWSPSVNYGLFGLITLAYLGTEVPLNMGGEITGKRVIPRHLFWGTVLTLIGYFIATFTVLIVQGSAAASIGGFAIIGVVDAVFGHVVSGVTTVCIMSFFVMVPIVYNYTFARLLLVGGIDKRLPVNVARLNKNRIPANAILFQTAVAIVFTVLAFLVAPYVLQIGGKATDLAIEVYNVSQASATLVWAVSTTFFFVDLVIFYLHDRTAFHKQRIFPMPVLAACVVIGPIACFIAIVDTLLNSWIGQISNSQWWYIVGGITLVCLTVAAIGSMLASSEASWQELKK